MDEAGSADDRQDRDRAEREEDAGERPGDSAESGDDSGSAGESFREDEEPGDGSPTSRRDGEPDDGSPNSRQVVEAAAGPGADARTDPEERAEGEPSRSADDDVAEADEETPGSGSEDAAGGRSQTQATTRRDAEATADREVGDDADTTDVDAAPDATGGDVPEDVRSYDRFTKVDRASYDRVNEFLRDRTYITAREWAIARLCADFRTATGVEMTKIGENLPHLVPFMTDTYSPQAVNQARSAFEEKVRMAGATFLYGAMSGFFTADELDDLMYEVTEVAKFLLEVEGVELTVEEELDAEDRISAVMREVRRASEELRYEEVACPHCGEAFEPESAED